MVESELKDDELSEEKIEIFEHNITAGECSDAEDVVVSNTNLEAKNIKQIQ